MSDTGDHLAPLQPEAAAAVADARRLAARAGRPVAGPDDLALALVRAPLSSAGALLALARVDGERVREALEDIAQPALIARDDAALGPDLGAILDLAGAEAARLGHGEVWCVHLVLGILQGQSGLARRVLESAGLDLETARPLARFLYDPGSVEPPDFERLRGALHPGEDLRHNIGPMRLVDDPSPETAAWAERMRAQYERMAGLFDPEKPDDLVRVIGVGQTVVAAGTTVDLISIEVRTRRTLISWRARQVGREMLGQPEVVVADDVGTDYMAIVSSSSGNGREMAGEILLAPPPAPDARRLTVTIGQFSYDGPAPTFFLRRGGSVIGPWVFAIPLT